MKSTLTRVDHQYHSLEPEGETHSSTFETLSSLEITRNFKGEYGYTCKFYIGELSFPKAEGSPELWEIAAQEQEKVRVWFEVKFGKGGE